MANFKKMFLSLQAKIIYLILVVILLFSLVLYYTAQQRLSDFRTYHQNMANAATYKVAHKVHDIILRKRKLVQNFYEDNIDLIRKIIHNPQDYQYTEELNTKLARYFNDYFATNITDGHAQFIVDEFEGHIGRLCLADIKDYIKSSKQVIRIHPNYNVHHYDIFANMPIDEKNYTFFVSFNTNEIANLLQISQNTQHSLIIVNTKIEDLIAITVNGSRDVLVNRHDIYILQEERQRVLSSRKIPGTQWAVIDLNDDKLFSTYKEKLINEASIVFVFFFGIIALMAYIIISALRTKEALSHALIQKNATILSLNSSLKELSIKDSLTGLYNRRYYDENSLLKWQQSKRLNLNYNIALLDIDFFKQYNDNYGHPQGDKCLLHIAQMIKKYFNRANEFSARYGGEEFVVVNMGDKKEAFAKRLQELLESLNQEKILHEFSTASDYLSLSIGSSSSKDSLLTSPQEHLEEADKNLYKAKENGKNRLIS